MMVSIPEQLLSSLDLAVLERDAAHAFHLIGQPPAWLPQIFPQFADPSAAVDLASTSLYLEHFLAAEAEPYWAAEAPQVPSVTSAPWTEVGPGEAEWLLEAVALTVDGCHLLLLRFPHTDARKVHHVLQESREQGLALHRLLKEMDKREVLLHCIVHDLSTPLAGVKGSLELMQEDALLNEDGAHLCRLALNQVQKMQAQIRLILNTFADDVRALLPTGIDNTSAPDLCATVRDVTALLRPVAQRKEVTLALDLPDASDCRIAGEGSRLERVLFNLIDNALRYAPFGSAITLRVAEEDHHVGFSIEDEGEGVPPAAVSTLFDRGSQGIGLHGQAGLGLYFCRLTISDWGGTMGYRPADGGGACFWFRVPRPRPM